MLKNEAKLDGSFDVHRRTQNQNTVIFWMFSGAVMLCVAAIVHGWNVEKEARERPPAVILLSGATGAPAQVLRGEELAKPKLTDEVVKNFFINMIRYRYGWSSLTMERDMQAFLDQCYHSQRDPTIVHMNEPVPVPGKANATQKRRAMWVNQMVQNVLVLPKFDDIQCKREAANVWTCNMEIRIGTQELQAPFASTPPKPWAVMGTFLPVDFSTETPYGLVVGKLQEFARRDGEG